MNWALDNAGLADRDLARVFKYQEEGGQSVLVHIDAQAEQSKVWTPESTIEWHRWIETECPNITKCSSGLVLMLAIRIGEPLCPKGWGISLEQWLQTCEDSNPQGHTPRGHRIFASVAERLQKPAEAHLHAGTSTSGQRSVRTLPFSVNIFRLVTRSFHTHGSIAPVISRMDIPAFSSAEVRIEAEDKKTYPAFVYNCRTTNAWDMDLALTATYFPHCRSTFAIAFGCPLDILREILRRLSLSIVEAAHPLIMPGILAEMERIRHGIIIDEIVTQVETKILELESHRREGETASESEIEMRNLEKREQWLDTTYLRNSLQSWNTQLIKMNRHVDELKRTVFKVTQHGKRPKNSPPASKSEVVAGRATALEMEGSRRIGGQLPPDHDAAERTIRSQSPHDSRMTEEELSSCHRQMGFDDTWEVVSSCFDDDEHSVLAQSRGLSQRDDVISGDPTVLSKKDQKNLQDNQMWTDEKAPFEATWKYHSHDRGNGITSPAGVEAGKDRMRRVSVKIKDRLQDIIDEYKEKIRDCTMRVDGMAMATQWTYGETNIQIARDTSRDSKVMRSIALVTMLFLPGTFVATFFSMTFFNWSKGDNGIMSDYIWVYLLLTAIFTGLTVGGWYYFIVRRSSKPLRDSLEERLSLSGRG